jgi:predicted aspartyl protease
MKGFFKFGSPFIKLHFEGKEIDFLLDTGFNGYLVIQ